MPKQDQFIEVVRHANGMTAGQPGVSHSLALLYVGLRHIAEEVTHPPEVGCPLGHADGAAGIEQVKRVGTAQYVVVGGDHQP